MNDLDKYFADLKEPARTNRDLSAGWMIQRRAMGAAAARVAEYLEKETLLLCESPIEQLFFAALDAEIVLGGHPHNMLIASAPATYPKFVRPLFIQPQTIVCGTRVDFLVTTNSPHGLTSLVVECDGYDFHERTSEQASRDRMRDRAFQAEGYSIFRFTGQQINRDPCLCAFEVALWAEKTLRGG